MPQEISLTTEPRQSLRVNVGDQDFRFLVWWQPSDESWYVTVHRLDGEAVTDGERLAAGTALLSGRSDLIGGAFTVEEHEAGVSRELMRDAWETHRLLWFSPEEIAP